NAIIDSAKPALLISESELWDEVEKVRDSRAVTEPGGALRVLHLDPSRKRGSSAATDSVTAMSRESLAIVAYTSGSTGTAKGCMHSHGDILAVCDSYARYVLKPTSIDRFGGHPTMAFVYGLGGMLLFPFRFSASTVLLDKFTPEGLADTIRRHKVTIA